MNIQSLTWFMEKAGWNQVLPSSGVEQVIPSKEKAQSQSEYIKKRKKGSISSFCLQGWVIHPVPLLKGDIFIDLQIKNLFKKW